MVYFNTKVGTANSGSWGIGAYLKVIVTCKRMLYPLNLEWKFRMSLVSVKGVKKEEEEIKGLGELK